MGNLVPVILGGDIGVYAIGRSFHELLGCRSIAVCHAPAQVVARSSFFDVEHVPAHARDDALLAVLRGIAAVRRGETLVLMGNYDAHTAFVTRHAEELGRAFVLPFPTKRTVDLVTDKQRFGELCERLGVATPRTRVVDLEGADAPDWRPPALDIDFPLVAKPALGDAYEQVDFPGKRKIWYLRDGGELESMWAALREGGFRDRFLLQELIPGDDTAMRSITAYVDSAGTVSLIGSARVLLEDHAPRMLGNPVAMITEPFEDLWRGARAILGASGYRGFANFDVKVDPRDGRACFLEVNARIGRNSYYMTAAGDNPMVPMLADLVEHRPLEPIESRTSVLYSLVPLRLLSRYVRDAGLRARVRSLAKQGRVVDPLVYGEERDPRRRALVALQRLNQYRKFRRYYPKPTDLSF